MKSKLIAITACMAASLIPLPALAEMCTGTIVSSTARVLEGNTARVSNYYKKGMRVTWITSIRRELNQSFFCSWGGDCISANDIRLDRIMAVRGDTRNMNGYQVKENSYETQNKCNPSNLRQF